MMVMDVIVSCPSSASLSSGNVPPGERIVKNSKLTISVFCVGTEYLDELQQAARLQRVIISGPQYQALKGDDRSIITSRK